MTFLEALDVLQDHDEVVAIYRTSQPTIQIEWHKRQFIDFYSGKVVLISKEQLFAKDWVTFCPKGK